MKKLIIFDLDGTLLNTIADLAVSTNQALEQFGFSTHQVEEYRYFVGNGVTKMFECALPESARTEENILKIRSRFIPYYDAHNADFSSPYPGIPELLASLQQRGVMLAVASNKYQTATEKLIANYFPTIRFTAVLGQRGQIPVKPDPTIVNDILTLSGVSREETLYIGDSNVDMQTALNAQVEAAGVAWGFRPVEELAAYHPAHIVYQVEEIERIVFPTVG